MDDLNQQLQKILSDPQAMGQIQTFWANSQRRPPEPPTAAQSSSGPDLSSLLGAWGRNAWNPSKPLPGGDHTSDFSAMTRLMPLLSQAGQEDDATRLLRALRPLLGHARQKKVDEAIRILQMLRLLPLLKREACIFRAAVRSVIERRQAHAGRMGHGKMREEAARRPGDAGPGTHLPKRGP